LAKALSIDAHGWLRGVARIPSPNSDERPGGCHPSLVVVHGISLPPGEFGGPWIDRLFTNTLPADGHEYFATIDKLRVSAHALVRRDGEIRQYVPFTRRAWHAGESTWCGRQRCNDFSIGIELEGTDDIPYEEPQYATLARLVAALRQAYPTLRDAEVVGHEDIAPGRKTDPGPSFDWARLERELETAGGGR
jgi:AmpD protein